MPLNTAQSDFLGVVDRALDDFYDRQMDPGARADYELRLVKALRLIHSGQVDQPTTRTGDDLPPQIEDAFGDLLWAGAPWPDMTLDWSDDPHWEEPSY